MKIETRILRYDPLYKEHLDRRRAFDVDRRQCMWYILRIKHKYTFQEIADAYGKNHSTIINGVNKITRFLEVNDIKTHIMLSQLRNNYDFNTNRE